MTLRELVIAPRSGLRRGLKCWVLPSAKFNMHVRIENCKIRVRVRPSLRRELLPCGLRLEPEYRTGAHPLGSCYRGAAGVCETLPSGPCRIWPTLPACHMGMVREGSIRPCGAMAEQGAARSCLEAQSRTVGVDRRVATTKQRQGGACPSRDF